MALDVREKERARYHLGYPDAGQVASIQLGIPRPLQTLFLFETAVRTILPEAEDRVRRILTVLDGIECRLIDAQDRLAAKRLDDLELRQDEPEMLEREYVRWGSRLADTLGCPIYPYAARYRNYLGAVAAGSIPRRS